MTWNSKHNFAVIVYSTACLMLVATGYYMDTFTVTQLETMPPRATFQKHVPETTTAHVTEAHYMDGDNIVRGIGSLPALDLDKTDPQILMDRAMLITGASQNHLAESMFMVGSVQTFWPNKTIIYYDLGLTQSGVQQVKRLCNVEYRKFNLSRYPPHFKNLFNYAWKPLLIQDALRESGIVFWCDASARFHGSPLPLFSVLKEQRGLVADIEFNAVGAKHMMDRTHPEMFRQLGVDRESFSRDLNHTVAMGGGRVILADTGLMRTAVVQPWVDCCLRKECISPKGSVLSMGVHGPHKWTHRFDQAALALLAYRNLKGVQRADRDPHPLLDRLVSVDRSPHGENRPQYCRAA